MLGSRQGCPIEQNCVLATQPIRPKPVRCKYNHPCEGSISWHSSGCGMPSQVMLHPAATQPKSVEPLRRSPVRGRRWLRPPSGLLLGSQLILGSLLAALPGSPLSANRLLAMGLHSSLRAALSSVSHAACCPLQVFGPFTFFDVPGKESIPENASSYVNLVEVEMVLNVYTLLVTRCGLSWRFLDERHG